MRLTRASGYGLYALLYLAAQPRDSHVPAGRIADSRGLPLPFLNKVLQALVRAGLVRSAAGASGGFSLAKPPGQVSLRQVVTALQGPSEQNGCLIKREECDQADVCAVNAVWRTIEAHETRLLSENTLADLLRPEAPACLSVSESPKRRSKKGRGSMEVRP